MLIQASKMYTPIILEAFQGEYERSMVACSTALEGNIAILWQLADLMKIVPLRRSTNIFVILESKLVHAVVGCLVELEYCVTILEKALI